MHVAGFMHATPLPSLYLWHEYLADVEHLTIRSSNLTSSHSLLSVESNAIHRVLIRPTLASFIRSNMSCLSNGLPYRGWHSFECCTTIRVTKVITEEERSGGLLKKAHQLQQGRLVLLSHHSLTIPSTTGLPSSFLSRVRG